MNKDEIKGKIDQVKGAAKEKIGEITDDPEFEVKGKVDKAGGKVREAYGEAKRKMKDIVEEDEPEAPHRP